MTNQISNLTLDELKQSLVNDLQERVNDKILEPSNFNLLKKLINNASDKTEAISIAELGTTYKRTGFHFDKRLEKLTDTIKYFKKNTELSFVTDSNKLTHKLIIGDNYDALLNLSISYKNKIDVIYIDPPYGKDDMGEFAHTNYDNAISRDNLLSMLYPRLVLARELLTDEGVIFCSIDDKNQAYVKGLFDEVFGEVNYIGEYIRKTKVGGGNDSKFVVLEHDYCIIFAKNKIKAENFAESHTEKYLRRYREEDSNGKYFWDTLARPNLRNPIYYDIMLPNGQTINKGWICSEQTYKSKLADGQIRIKELNNSEYSVQFKQYLNDKKIPRSLSSNFGSNADGTASIEEILGDKKLFNYPKPVEFIKKILSTIQNTDIIVLDFFAGSGTTGQAVLELNKEDNGSRQFILVTNNEITDTSPNGIAFDVTSKRLKRVMSGECYDGTRNYPWCKNNTPLGDNLDVYEIGAVANNNQTTNESPFEVIDETLYGLDKLTPEEKIKFVCENFGITQRSLGE